MMRFSCVFILVILTAAQVLPGAAFAGEPMRVAVAANFLHTAQILAERYQQDSGEEITLSNGSSGTLFAQISNGAPYDLFLSADMVRPERLLSEGIAVKTEPYALGQLSLISRAGDGPPETLLGTARFAIADPSVAPYGEAALEVLASLGLDPVTLDLIYAENVSQAASWYASGNVSLALVSTSLAMGLKSDDPATDIIPMADYHTPVAQYSAVLTDDPRAVAFLELMKSDAGQEIISAAGYLPAGVLQ